MTAAAELVAKCLRNGYRPSYAAWPTNEEIG